MVKVDKKYYAFVECGNGRYEGNPFMFGWDKSSKWLSTVICQPKPLSYKYAKRKVEQEMLKDSDVSRTIVIRVDEYNRKGI